jgi:RNA polymerase subunit RPABC4/transcription elongation factor Spt4
MGHSAVIIVDPYFSSIAARITIAAFMHNPR